MPEEVIPLAIVSLGYPAEEKSEEKKEASRFKPERIHYERWQKHGKATKTEPPRRKHGKSGDICRFFVFSGKRKIMYKIVI